MMAERLARSTSNDTSLQRPELLVAGSAPAQDRRLQVLVSLVEDAEPLPDIVHQYGDVGHF